MLYLALLYCCHSQFNLVVGMVIRCFPVFSYMWVCSLCICIVSLLVRMFFSGLHSFMNICVRVIVVAGGMNLVSMFCSGVKCVFRIVL